MFITEWRSGTHKTFYQYTPQQATVYLSVHLTNRSLQNILHFFHIIHYLLSKKSMSFKTFGVFCFDPNDSRFHTN